MLQLLGFSALMQRFAAAARASYTGVANFTTGSALGAIGEANATIALWLQWLILVVLRQTRLATSIGAEVDTWVADFGMARLLASPAAGFVTMSRYTPGVVVTLAVGTGVQTSDGTQTFLVTADPTNAAWSGTGYTLTAAQTAITVPVAAAVPGAAGNVLAGSISTITTALPLDMVTNAAPFAGGLDQESDAALRARFILFVESRSAGTASAVQYAVASLRQGLACAVKENFAPDGTFRPGFFTVVVDDGTGSPPPALLTAVFNAVDTVRPVGTSFVVQPPSVIVANVSMTITAAPGYFKPSLIGQVAAVLLAYIDGLPIEASLDYSALAWTALNVTGVANAQAILLNGATADIGGGFGQSVRATASTIAVA